jgi:hypothetical protein
MNSSRHVAHAVREIRVPLLMAIDITPPASLTRVCDQFYTPVQAF